MSAWMDGWITACFLAQVVPVSIGLKKIEIHKIEINSSEAVEWTQSCETSWNKADQCGQLPLDSVTGPKTTVLDCFGELSAHEFGSWIAAKWLYTADCKGKQSRHGCRATLACMHHSRSVTVAFSLPAFAASRRGSGNVPHRWCCRDKLWTNLDTSAAHLVTSRFDSNRDQARQWRASGSAALSHQPPTRPHRIRAANPSHGSVIL